jgi:hypothetical protein
MDLCFLVHIYNGDKNSTIHESLFTQIFYIIDFGIFISGLPPMLLVVYFLILGKHLKILEQD